MKKLILISFLLVAEAIAINAQQNEFLNNREESNGEIPSRFDWREKMIMTPVKHQMNLGSCGVFAAVSVFEALVTPGGRIFELIRFQANQYR